MRQQDFIEDDDFTDDQLSQINIPDDVVVGSVDNGNPGSCNLRFADVTSETVNELRSYKDAKNTIKNTSWGCGVLEGKTIYLLHPTQIQICHFFFFLAS